MPACRDSNICFRLNNSRSFSTGPKRFYRLNRPRRGAAVLEMAVCLSVLVFLSFGMIEFGYYFYTTGMLQSSAREGARAGVPSVAGNSDITTAAANALATCNWPAGSYAVAVTDMSNNAIDVSTAKPGTQLRVTVTVTWGTVAAGFRPIALIGAGKQVTGVCVMRKEG